MSKLKIVVTGPVFAGKTTFIHSLADRPPVSTEQSIRNPSDKEKTTVALDFARTTVAGHPVNLFGTPGQERFQYMRELLVEGTDGLVLLVPGDQEDGLEKTLEIMAPLTTDTTPPLVIGVTRTDLAENALLEKTRQTLGSRVHRIEQIDAREEDHCRDLVTTLINQV